VLLAIVQVAGLGRVVAAAPDVATAQGDDITAALEDLGSQTITDARRLVASTCRQTGGPADEQCRPLGMNCPSGKQASPVSGPAKEAGMATGDQYGAGWTVVLPLQTVSIATGRREGGYTAPCEIRCDCGDHPDLAYRETFPRLQRIRGPYLTADGGATYEIRRGPGLAARGGAPAGMTDVADWR
jgi:hypothetical protein